MNELEKNLICSYYSAQVERVKAHEEQREKFSNIVMATTLAIAALAFKDDSTDFNLKALPLLIIALNSITLIYISRSHETAVMHNLKNKEVLKTFAPDLYKLLELPHLQYKYSGYSRSLFFKILHCMFIIYGAIAFFSLNNIHFFCVGR